MPNILNSLSQSRWTFVRLICAMAIVVMTPAPAMALNEGLQCVPYARAISGVEIYGDAHTWWGKAKGKYERGSKPRVGAVLSFKSHGSSRLGHIAAVRALVDKRTILVSHANWSRINGKRGHIEDDVQVVDVSQKNDWSKVKVWYQPIGALGGTSYPINGFIYPKSQKSHTAVKASIAKLTGRPVSRVKLSAKPNIGKIKGLEKSNTRLAQADKPKKKAIAYKPKKAKKRDFSLGRSFLNDLDKKSAKERRNAQRERTAQASNHDPIGDLLGQVSY